MDALPPNLRRRRILVLAAIGAAVGCTGGAACAAEQGRTPSKKKKYTKERVGYRDEPYNGRTCAVCMLYAGDGDCAIVEGIVSRNGWCTQWTPATMGANPSGIA